jgi:putative hydrolase of the HAD superfamily
MAKIALFDFGNVVAHWDVAPRMQEYARRSGFKPSEVQARLATDGFWASTDRGLCSGDEMERRICELLGCAFSREELHRLQALAFVVDPEVLALAEAVSQRLRVGILTNNAPLLHEALPHHFPEVVRLFDPILFSFQLGHVKPELELFEAAQAQLGLEPGEILFIDDTLGHVRAALSLGWDAVHYQSVPELREALVARDILA